MKKLISVIWLSACVALAGCAPTLVAREAPLVEGKELNFLHTPVESLGIRVTENLLKGKVFTVRGYKFPRKAFSEEYPGRVSWKAWVANLKTGGEFFAQVARSKIQRDGNFVPYLMVDSDSLEAMEGNGAIGSSNLSWIADLAGNVFPLDAQAWRSDKQYRLFMLEKCGSPLKNAFLVEGFEKSVLSWNLAEIKGVGDVRVPYSEQSLKDIAAINPAYSLLEKIALKGNLTVFMDPVATLSNVALNIIVASGVKSEGWDYTSNLPPNRMVMGSIIEYIMELHQKLIWQLNQELAEERRISDEKPLAVSAGTAAGSSSKRSGK